MTPKTIWKAIQERAFKGRDPDWIATNIAPLQPWIEDDSFILFAPNVFVSEIVASVAPEIRAALPSAIRDFVITIGEPPKTDAGARPALLESNSTNTSSKQLEPAPRAKALRKRQVSQEAQAEGMLSNIWPRDMRAMPADFLRSSLFTINRYGLQAKRPMRSNTLLFSMSNFEIRVTGAETNVFDAEVHAQILHYARNQPFGTTIWFSLRELCTDLDLSTSGESIQRVRESLHRLHDTRVVISRKGADEKTAISGNLIASFSYQETKDADRWRVEIGTHMLELLGPGVQTRYLLEMDRALKSSLARYLLRFYSSHTKHVYPIKVETMRSFTGTNMSLREFRRALKNALNELLALHAISSWEIEDDKIKVEKEPLKQIT
jgi:plasmid replication initiation protein